MIRLRDALQREIVLSKPPRRVVSLVPSDTLSVAALGAADRLVGRTDYCVEPADALASVPTLGGTKNPRIDEVIALEPDLILVNQEENSRRDVERLMAERFLIYVAFPRRVAEGVAHLAALARMLGVHEQPGPRDLVRRAYHALREADLDWSRVLITLVDERCVAPDHADSNERLVREHLLAGRAAAARLAGLVRDPADIAGSVATANAAARPITVALLGMGEDGHTASLFPGAPELAAGLDPANPARYLAVTPPSAPHARISLTLAALLQSRLLVLAIAGPIKRRVFDAACAAFSPDLPVSALVHQTRTPLDVYWAP